MGSEGRTITENSLTAEQWRNSQVNEAAFWKSQKGIDNLEQRQRNSYYRGLLEDGCDIAKRFFEQDFTDKFIVDVGSGPEGILHVLKARRKVAIDPLMDIYRAMGYDVDANDVETLSSMGEQWAFNEPVDVAVCLNALDHSMSPEFVIQTIARNLITGGDFLLITDMRTPEQLDAYHKLSLDESDIHNFLTFNDHSQYIGIEILEEHVYPHQAGNPVMQYIAWCRKYL